MTNNLDEIISYVYVLDSHRLPKKQYLCTVMIRVACIGDSITLGFTLLNPWKQSYPALLHEGSI